MIETYSKKGLYWENSGGKIIIIQGKTTSSYDKICENILQVI